MPHVPIANLRRVLEAADAARLVDLYVSGSEGSSAEKYKMFARRLDAKRFVLPVAGVQGAGKSTFLNAIAFRRPVLPIDAEETTAVPVEIAYAARPSGQARVVFQDGRTEAIDATEDALAEFVHNGRNPGNVKGVDRILLDSSVPELQTGLVLVDLPGIGSLTQANIETTKRYLREAVGLVFLLRTVPPMTRSEGLFVASNWARLPMAFFVLNRWTDEHDGEVQDGLEYAVGQLEKIAAQNHIEGLPIVDVVVAYRALEGRLKSDDSLVVSSQLPAFLDRVRTAACEWPLRVAETIAQTVQNEIHAALGCIEREIADLTSDRAEVERRMVEEEERFRKYFARLESLLAEATKDVLLFAEEQKSTLAQWVASARPTLRNNMRTKMRGGIVDGERLSMALLDEQGQEADKAFDPLQEAILAFQDRMRERFKEVPAWSAQRPNSFHDVHFPQKPKFENVFPWFLGSAGGLAGGAAGAEIGVKVGALIGTPAGPIGIGVGVVVGGLLGGVLGTWLGSKTKQVATTWRASDAEPEVFKAIDRFTEDYCRDLGKQILLACEGVIEMLAGWRHEQCACYAAERGKCLEMLGASMEERDARLARLRSDETQLRTTLCQLSDGTP